MCSHFYLAMLDISTSFAVLGILLSGGNIPPYRGPLYLNVKGNIPSLGEKNEMNSFILGYSTM